MSAKLRDRRGRLRNKTVAFRVSKEESDKLNYIVKVSGLTKQEFITRNLFSMPIIVQGNPLVYKALMSSFKKIYDHLRRIDKVGDNSLEYIEYMKFATEVFDRMQYTDSTFKKR